MRDLIELDRELMDKDLIVFSWLSEILLASLIEVEDDEALRKALKYPYIEMLW